MPATRSKRTHQNTHVRRTKDAPNISSKAVKQTNVPTIPQTRSKTIKQTNVPTIPVVRRVKRPPKRNMDGLHNSPEVVTEKGNVSKSPHDLEIKNFKKLNIADLERINTVHNFSKKNNFLKKMGNVSAWLNLSKFSIKNFEKLAQISLLTPSVIKNQMNSRTLTFNGNKDTRINGYTRPQIGRILEKHFGDDFLLTIDAIKYNTKFDHKQGSDKEIKLITKSNFLEGMSSQRQILHQFKNKIVNTIATFNDSATTAKNGQPILFTPLATRFINKSKTMVEHQIINNETTFGNTTVENGRVKCSLKFITDTNNKEIYSEPSTNNQKTVFKLRHPSIIIKTTFELRNTTLTIYQYCNGQKIENIESLLELVQVDRKQQEKISKKVYIEKEGYESYKQLKKTQQNSKSNQKRETVNLILHYENNSGFSIELLKKIIIKLIYDSYNSKAWLKMDETLMRLLFAVKRVADDFQFQQSRVLTEALEKPLFILSFDRLGAYIGVKKGTPVIAQLKGSYMIYLPQKYYTRSKRYNLKRKAEQQNKMDIGHKANRKSLMKYLGQLSSSNMNKTIMHNMKSNNLSNNRNKEVLIKLQRMIKRLTNQSQIQVRMPTN